MQLVYVYAGLRVGSLPNAGIGVKTPIFISSLFCEQSPVNIHNVIERLPQEDFPATRQRRYLHTIYALAHMHYENRKFDSNAFFKVSMLSLSEPADKKCFATNHLQTHLSHPNTSDGTERACVNKPT